MVDRRHVAIVEQHVALIEHVILMKKGNCRGETHHHGHMRFDDGLSEQPA
jgi:hypothetical protein